MIVQLASCGHRENPPSPSGQADRPVSGGSTAPTPHTAAPAHVSSLAILARCQPELKQSPAFVPTFEIDERYNRAAVQLKVRFVVDGDGFVMNVYLVGANVVGPADQEAALDYVRHLTFDAPDGEECKAIKMQMVGTFHMAKDSSDDWTTVFDVHPVYSFNGDKVVVNPN
jgi:hypothetical protein